MSEYSELQAFAAAEEPDTLQEAARRLLRAWDAWRDTAAPAPSGELDDALDELREAVDEAPPAETLSVITGGGGLSVGEYVRQYFGLPEEAL